MSTIAHSQVKQPWPSVAKPSAQLRSHGAGAHASTHAPLWHAGTRFAAQLGPGIGHATPLHAFNAGSLAGTANVGQSQHFAAAAAHCDAAEHSGAVPIPSPYGNDAVSELPKQPVTSVRTTTKVRNGV